MRSLWKGRYQPLNIFKQLVGKARQKVRIYARAFWLTAQLAGRSFSIYNGKSFTSLDVSPMHVGHRVGEFARTRAFFVPKVKKAKAKAKKKAKAKAKK
jgi:ribosomal protein S19